MILLPRCWAISTFISWSLPLWPAPLISVVLWYPPSTLLTYSTAHLWLALCVYQWFRRSVIFPPSCLCTTTWWNCAWVCTAHLGIGILATAWTSLSHEHHLLLGPYMPLRFSYRLRLIVMVRVRWRICSTPSTSWLLMKRSLGFHS